MHIKIILIMRLKIDNHNYFQKLGTIHTKINTENTRNLFYIPENDNQVNFKPYASYITRKVSNEKNYKNKSFGNIGKPRCTTRLLIRNDSSGRYCNTSLSSI